MDALENPVEILSIATLILLMLLNTHQALEVCSDEDNNEEPSADVVVSLPYPDTPALDLHAVSRAALQHFRLWSTAALIDEDFGFWMRPRSTTWFSRFLLEEYDDKRWVQMFRMTKRAVFSLAHLLTPTILRRDTNYRLAIPVTVRVACTLFKLSHGVSLLICSEMFAVGCSTISMMLREVVNAVNLVLRSEISWPCGDMVGSTSSEFEQLCGLPGVLGAIDGTHFHISKPKFGAADYYYFKSGGYSMNCQAVVDSSKRFLDLYVGMPGSTNDSRMLRRSTLYHRGQRKLLWDGHHNFHGFAPYLIGDAGYPLLPWLMVPHRQYRAAAVADQLFNRKLSKGRTVVENAFAMLKLTFKELHQKSDLHVTFMPDVVTYCAILHNILLKQSHDEVECLLEVLRMEACHSENDQSASAPNDGMDPIPEDLEEREGLQKRRDLGVFLSLQRIVPT